MDTNIKNELQKDFEAMLGKVNFVNYNPNSPEFQNALNVGLMLHILEKGEEYTAIEAEHEEYKDIEYPDIADEISSAKKYLQIFNESHESMYVDMCRDELKHADFLIKKAYSRLPNAQNKEKLKLYEIDVEKIKSFLQGKS